jgi:hypothetical protein
VSPREHLAHWPSPPRAAHLHPARPKPAGAHRPTQLRVAHLRVLPTPEARRPRRTFPVQSSFATPHRARAWPTTGTRSPLPLLVSGRVLHSRAHQLPRSAREGLCRHESCCRAGRWAAGMDVLPEVYGFATRGGRTCYNGTTLLPTAAGVATSPRQGCYQGAASLLPTTVDVATNP